MTGPIPPKVRVDCGKELFIEISSTIQFAITGKKVLVGDSLKDLVDRYCAEAYKMASDKGYRLEPNDNPIYLRQKPPQAWFSIVRTTRKSWAH